MINKLLLAIFLLSFFALVAASSAPAQNTPEAAIISARDQFFDIKRRSIELERMKRESQKRPSSQNLTLKFTEIKKDFETIQKLNYELLELAAAKKPLNYAAVSKSASEINQRAARLKSNLFPPPDDAEPDDKESPNKEQSPAAKFESQELKTLLGALDKSINNFVHNAIFQNLKLVNPADSVKAQKDLEAVISIAQAIKVKTKN